ncbi:hypothetical protein HF324_08140 [Chitinophaga oryzae]|uniref:Uncharacterized protein n=1 Tax=Chitinophaga oryzae TaxID=2725414 RepID=A0AAE7D7T7_9BACT|nr:hypothetical protein [Chitinophaga oryzae]QJB31337.1 hypothetical protein HF329_08480 [Chitinophaga oryzae]QJB37822.1 hypothetical protein HF324_08140 [Chitinophaga oryzae]
MTTSIQFENVSAILAENPGIFSKPAAEELSRLTFGDTVCLFFVYGFSSTSGRKAERLMARVTAVEAHQYKGVLLSPTRHIQNIQPGDEITFSGEHIAAVLAASHC